MMKSIEILLLNKTEDIENVEQHIHNTTWKLRDV